MSTIPAWVRSHARTSPERVAIEDLTFERTLTYAALSDRIDRLAGHLFGLGVKRGDRVAVLARNSHHVLEVQYACAALGAIFVPFNFRLSAAELVAAAEDCRPSLVFFEAFAADRAAAIGGPRLAWSSDAGTESDYERALTAATPIAGPIEPRGEEPWTIIYTSGTTGTPKGVVLSHASAQATMLSVLVGSRVTAETVTLTILPFCHVAGLNLFTNPTLFAAGHVVLFREYDPKRTLALLTRSEARVTHVTGVPAVFQFMQGLPEWAAHRFDGLLGMVGGSPVPDVLTRSWCEKGAQMQTVYGISEAGAAVLMVPHGDGAARVGTVGLPLMHVRARIVDTDDNEVSRGTVGELLIGGPSVTPGYWNKPELTAQTIRDGWLHTGDAAVWQEDGYFRIADRYKDMYISGGENVVPAEVENVLYRHAAIAECAVVGMPDEKWGEVGHAFVVLKAGASLDVNELQAFAREYLAAFKVPRHLTILTALPRNNTGKILKRDLRKGPA